MTTTIGSLDLNAFNDLYSDSNQYFWFESNASATYGAGAHVTLVPDTTFISNPTGQNILMNTDGFSIRNGLLPMMTLNNDSLDFNVVNTLEGTYTPVATFGKTGATIGLVGESRADIDFHSMKLIDANGESYFIANDLRDVSGLSIIKQTFTATSAMYDNSGIIYPIYTPVTQIVDVVDENGESWLDEVSIDLKNAGTANEYFDISTQHDDSGTQLTIIYKSTSVAYNYLLGTYKVGGNAGPYSAVIGKNNEASGVASIAEGSNTSAKGFGCHAEGVGTLATYSLDNAEKVGAHAEGVNSKAFGLGAHAEGYDTRSTYKGHAQNEGTNANAVAQTAIGTYNTIDASPTTTHPNGINSYGEYAFLIGNGVSDDARSNALTVDWAGNVDIASGASYSIGGVPIADYIVEQGTSDIWTYRKWASGISECWGIVSFTSTGSTAWGNVYWVTPNTRVNFPTSLFTSAPTISVSTPNNAVQGWGASNNISASWVDVFLMRPTSAGSGLYIRLDINAKGRWK